MAIKKMSSVKGRVARITRLDECGLPVIGTCSSVVTKGFITVDYSFEVEAGDESTQKNAWGELCVNEKDPDVRKWVNTVITFCEIDPTVLDIIAGATPVVVGTDTIGEEWDDQPNFGRFALEVWTKVAGQDACAGGTIEWGYFVVPNLANGALDGSMTVENGVMNVALAAEGFPAGAAWGLNPYGDNPMRKTAGLSAGAMLGRVRTNVQPPAATVGCVELFDRTAIGPGDTFPPNPSVTAQDATNAAALVGLGYTTSGAAWATGEFFSIGTYQFNWTGSAWAAGAHA